jgi:hypothetical protein
MALAVLGISTTASEVISFIEAIASGIPAAVQAYENIKSVIAAGGQVSQDQWNAAIASIDAANAAVQAAEPPAGTTLTS